MQATRITDVFEPLQPSGGRTRKNVAMQALAALRRAGLVTQAPSSWHDSIPAPEAQRVRAALETHGYSLPDGSFSLRDVLFAVTGDLDQDRRIDVDLGALVAAGIVPARVDDQRRVDLLTRADRARPLPIQETLDLRNTAASLQVGWVRRGHHTVSIASGRAPERFLLELDETGRGELSLLGRPGAPRHHFSLRPEPRVHRAGSQTIALNQMLASIVLNAAARSEEGSPLRRAGEVLALDRALASTREPPSDPALSTIWHAKHATPAARAEGARALRAELGLEPRNYLPWIRHAGDVGVAKVIHEVARRSGIEPGLLFVTLGAEGLWFSHFDRNGERDVGGPDIGARVDGFAALGSDTFSSRVVALKAEGHLRPDFRAGVDFVPTHAVNERGRSVRSAIFADFTRGAEAVAALLSQSRAEFIEVARVRFGDDAVQALNADQLAYFTSLYYNSGTRGRERVLARGLSLEAQRHRKSAPTTNDDPHANAVRRLATLKLLGRLGVFERPRDERY